MSNVRKARESLPPDYASETRMRVAPRAAPAKPPAPPCKETLKSIAIDPGDARRALLEAQGALAEASSSVAQAMLALDRVRRACT